MIVVVPVGTNCVHFELSLVSAGQERQNSWMKRAWRMQDGAAKVCHVNLHILLNLSLVVGELLRRLARKWRFSLWKFCTHMRFCTGSDSHLRVTASLIILAVCDGKAVKCAGSHAYF